MNKKIDRLKLYVDDERTSPDGWILAKNYDEAIAILIKEEGNIYAISLDHDLGGIGTNEKTGQDIALWLEKQVYTQGYKAPRHMTSHSQNPVGKQNIKLTLYSIWKFSQQE